MQKWEYLNIQLLGNQWQRPDYINIWPKGTLDLESIKQRFGVRVNTTKIPEWSLTESTNSTTKAGQLSWPYSNNWEITAGKPAQFQLKEGNSSSSDQYRSKPYK